MCTHNVAILIQICIQRANLLSDIHTIHCIRIVYIISIHRNQQRSRRFRAAKEQEALLADYVAKEGKLPDEKSFDSNCITPGTEFMFRLGRYFLLIYVCIVMYISICLYCYVYLCMCSNIDMYVFFAVKYVIMLYMYIRIYIMCIGIAFRRWIDYKIETDPFWQTGAEVVFSGPDVSICLCVYSCVFCIALG